jgi:hypothetical protein
MRRGPASAPGRSARRAARAPHGGRRARLAEQEVALDGVTVRDEAVLAQQHTGHVAVDAGRRGVHQRLQLHCLCAAWVGSGLRRPLGSPGSRRPLGAPGSPRPPGAPMRRPASAQVGRRPASRGGLRAARSRSAPRSATPQRGIISYCARVSNAGAVLPTAASARRTGAGRQRAGDTASRALCNHQAPPLTACCACGATSRSWGRRGGAACCAPARS